MKALTLLLLRITTGVLLMVWGMIKINAPETAAAISNKYYFGVISADTLQMPLGIAQVALGALVIIGLFRIVTYPIQALVLVGGALAIWQYILDPLGMYILDESSRQLLFFPSSTVAVASLILLAFKEYDTIAVDRVFSRG